MKYILDKNTKIDWIEATEVIRKAPLGTREPDKLKRAFESSQAVVYVFDNKKLIGMGRALSDGEYQSAIYDVVILPNYQGKGIGKKMMLKLLEQLDTESIILFAAPGKEEFYSKLEFKKMLTGMAIFSGEMSDPENGYITNT